MPSTIQTAGRLQLPKPCLLAGTPSAKRLVLTCRVCSICASSLCAICTICVLPLLQELLSASMTVVQGQAPPAATQLRQLHLLLP